LIIRGAATKMTPKFVSPSDPAAQWTGAMRGPAFFAYSNNYLIDVKVGIIMDVEASRAIRQAEVGVSKTMIECGVPFDPQSAPKADPTPRIISAAIHSRFWRRTGVNVGQSLTAQLAELKAANCERIFQEKVSGVRAEPLKAVTPRVTSVLFAPERFIEYLL
jgi:hypothetical protein